MMAFFFKFTAVFEFQLNSNTPLSLFAALAINFIPQFTIGNNHRFSIKCANDGIKQLDGRNDVFLVLYNNFAAHFIRTQQHDVLKLANIGG